MNDDVLLGALDVLRHAEGDCDLLPDPVERTMTVRDWEAFDASDSSIPRGWKRRLPIDLSRPLPEQGRQVTARLATPLVRLSKFSSETGVRLRAFYPQAPEPLTLKLLVAEPDNQTAMRDEVAARHAMEASASFPAPTLHAEGFTPTYAYFVETMRTGHHPVSGPARLVTAERVLRRLLEAHRTAGVTDERITWHGETEARLERLLSWVEWDASWPEPGEVLRRSIDLIETDATMPCGWCHGDLVFSNIIVRGEEFDLVDWEHAHRGPLASDFGKLIAATYEPMKMVPVLEDAATPADIGARDGRYPVRSQLGISYLRELSWWEGKRTRAEAAGRMVNFTRWVRHRLDLVSELVVRNPGA